MSLGPFIVQIGFYIIVLLIVASIMRGVLGLLAGLLAGFMASWLLVILINGDVETYAERGR